MYARRSLSPRGLSIGRSELSKVTFDLDTSIRDQCMFMIVGSQPAGWKCHGRDFLGQ